MRASRFETRLAKLDRLAASLCNVHESELAQRRATEMRALALCRYALSQGNPFVARLCDAALKGNPDARLTMLELWSGIWSDPRGRAAVLAVEEAVS